MSRTSLLCLFALLSAASVGAEELSPNAVAASEPKSAAATASAHVAKDKASKSESDAKTLSGMSILGNQEAPKALVIVPWKSSQLGDPLGLSKNLDDGRGPVDKDVFMRELAYYEIRSGSK